MKEPRFCQGFATPPSPLPLSGHRPEVGRERGHVHNVYWRQHLHLLVAAALVPFLAGIYYLSFWLRFEGPLGGRETACFRATVGWVLAVKLAWFVGLRTCRGWSRSVAFYDLVVLLRTATGGLLTAAMVQYLLAPLPAIPRSVLLLDWGATIVVIGGALRCCGECARRAGGRSRRPARCGC